MMQSTRYSSTADIMVATAGCCIDLYNAVYSIYLDHVQNVPFAPSSNNMSLVFSS